LKLTAADSEAGDRFSIGVALSGDTAVIGSFQDDDGGSNSGSAYVFVLPCSQCANCEAGKYSPAAQPNECFNCEAGKYSPAAQTDTCINCEAGKYSPAAQPDECFNCEAGKYSPAAQADTCINCEAGKYSPAAQADECFDCTAGKYSTQTGTDATTDSVCIDCIPGTYSVVGASACADCEAGKYSPAAQPDACINCAAGKYSNQTGTNANTIHVCIDCVAGKYSAAGVSACTDCEAGKYSMTGLGACIDCDAGMYSTVAQAHACIDCDPGKYSTQTGTSANAASVCIDCAAGKYSVAGSSACIDVVCTNPTTAGYVFTNVVQDSAGTNLDLSTGAFAANGITCAFGYDGTPVATACNTSGPYIVSGCTPACFENIIGVCSDPMELIDCSEAGQHHFAIAQFGGNGEQAANWRGRVAICCALPVAMDCTVPSVRQMLATCKTMGVRNCTC
jgi:hypothetical protein